MAAGDKPRFVVTSLEAPTPQRGEEALYCAWGNCDNDSKAVTCDLHSARTAATTVLAHARRLLLACAASVLHPAWRTPTLQHPALAQAPPSILRLTLFKVATQVKQYKDRVFLPLPTSCPSPLPAPPHFLPLPTSCPVQALLRRVPTWLALVPGPVLHTS
jgi:Transposase DDE domain group 1